MLDKILSVLAPHTCLVCGAEGNLLCVWCRLDNVPEVPSRCYHCHASVDQSAVCNKCRKNSPLKHVWVRTYYQSVPKNLIYQLKFGRAKKAAKTIAELLDTSLPALPKDTVVTYVPTATSRVRVRGYDQSQLIASHLAKQRSLPMARLLVRHGQTRQVGSVRTKRLEQAAKNYGLANNKRLSQKHILIVDDILTTGATLEAASRVLRKTGAKQVNAAVFAHKQ